MIRKLLVGLNKRKVKVFSLFLLCSFFAWTISKLSETYESRATFRIDYTNYPDTLLLKSNADLYLTAKVRTSGFRFLALGLNQKTIALEVDGVALDGGRYFLEAEEVKAQLDRQLANTITLLELDRQRLYVDLYQVISKQIEIEPQLTLNLAPNHILEGSLRLTPETVTVKGPSSEVRMIKKLKTETFVFEELTEGFSKTLTVLRPDSLANTIIQPKFVKVSGTVVRFSEREFEISITPKHLPEGYQMRTFPKKVRLVCKAALDDLKTLQAADFTVFADYAVVKDTDSETIDLELGAFPDGLYTVRLLEDEVEFVLEKL
ncbi:MAG: YbbR-like domain-containing protein [Flavobacteriaceae bacterium]|nr:YbbR-like domain-containing protein [Flavobacteriaceae bacterium]